MGDNLHVSTDSFSKGKSRENFPLLENMYYRGQVKDIVLASS